MALYKKYHRGVNNLDGIHTALGIVRIGTGFCGVGLLTPIFTVPLAFSMQITAVICGSLGLVSNIIKRCLILQANKHNKIRVLVESELNTIAHHVSKALTSGDISDEEFSPILGEK